MSSHSSLPSPSAHPCVSFHRVFPGFSSRPRCLRFPSHPFTQCNSEGKQMIINLQPLFPVERCWEGIVCALHVDIWASRQSRSGTQQRPTVLSNCHARLLQRSRMLQACWLHHKRRGCSTTARVERKWRACFHESSPATSFRFFFPPLYQFDPI